MPPVYRAFRAAVRWFWLALKVVVKFPLGLIAMAVMAAYLVYKNQEWEAFKEDWASLLDELRVDVLG